jgi:hypothetical protein
MHDRRVLRRIRHIPGQPVTYLQNPKVASKSIEATLWKAYDPEGAPDNPHGRKPKPFIDNHASEEQVSDLLASEFFTVVRNPYARFVSAFLNKVQRSAWLKISAHFGMEPEPRPSVKELLALIHDMPATDLDQHFRPQHINVLHGLAPIDFLGHMERMDEVTAFLDRHGFRMVVNLTNATGASERIGEILDDADLKAIRAIYEEDFRIFGYSEDPAISMPRTDGVSLSQDRSRLRALFRRHRRMRDAAGRRRSRFPPGESGV